MDEAVNKYGGMTVNERLYVAGWVYEFDLAIASKDVSAAIVILRRVELNGPNIKAIIESKGLSMP